MGGVSLGTWLAVGGACTCATAVASASAVLYRGTLFNEEGTSWLLSMFVRGEDAKARAARDALRRGAEAATASKRYVRPIFPKICILEVLSSTPTLSTTSFRHRPAHSCHARSFETHAHHELPRLASLPFSSAPGFQESPPIDPALRRLAVPTAVRDPRGPLSL